MVHMKSVLVGVFNNTNYYQLQAMLVYPGVAHYGRSNHDDGSAKK